MTMVDEILKLVQQRGVSFVQMEKQIPDFNGGDLAMMLGEDDNNILLWGGLTCEATEALRELLRDKKIHIHPTSFLTYVVDGRTLRYPIAKTKRKYKKLHWLPVTFDPGPGPAKKR